MHRLSLRCFDTVFSPNFISKATFSILNKDVIVPGQNIYNKKLDLIVPNQNNKNRILHYDSVNNNLNAIKELDPTAVIQKPKSHKFMEVFSNILQDIKDSVKSSKNPELIKHVERVAKYNLPNGKKQRGKIVVMAYTILQKPENLTVDNIRLASILGWCAEMLQTCSLIADDIIDKSETRRGVPCWYQNEDVGLTAVHDAMFLENSIYSILRRHFSSHPSYVPIVELFNDITLKSGLGESLDIIISNNGKPNLDHFTMKTYRIITKYKIAYYTFHLPIALAMYLANFHDPDHHRQAERIMLEIGHFFQVQDDFLDCFGDPKVTGKIGSDIREGKCTWLSVVALQRANSAQRQILHEHFGKDNPESISIIRNLYQELVVPKMFAQFEEDSYNDIRNRIEEMSKDLPKGLFVKIMDNLYKRDH